MLDNNISSFSYPSEIVGSDLYIKTEPNCPSDGSTYTVTINSQLITVTCGSGEHGSSDDFLIP